MQAHETPLHSAITQPDDAVFNKVIDIYQKYGVGQGRTCFGDYPIHTAAAKGTINRVVALLIRGLGRLDERNAQGQTPLHVAVCNRRLDLALDLIDRGADSLDPDVDGRNALDYAVLFHLDVERLLNKIPKDKLDEAKVKKYDEKLLLLAARDSDVVTVRVILKFFGRIQADLDSIRSSGEFAPIHIAAACGNLDYLQTFANATNSKLVCTSEVKQTPLLLAAAGSHLACLKLLVGRGANVRYTDSLGNNVLHIILEFGIKNGGVKKDQVFSKSFEEMLKLVPELIFLRNRDQIPPFKLLVELKDKTLLSVAAELIFQKWPILQLAAVGDLRALMLKLNQNPQLVTTTDDLGNTPLHVLFQFYLVLGKTLDREFFLAFDQLIKFLNVNQPNIFTTQNQLGTTISMLGDGLYYKLSENKKKPVAKDTIADFLQQVPPPQPLQIGGPNNAPMRFFFQKISKRPLSPFESNVTFAIDTKEVCPDLNVPYVDTSTEGYNQIISNSALKEKIAEHHARRVLLLFHTYIHLFGASLPIIPSREDVIIQHGIGAAGYHAAHSAFHNAFVLSSTQRYSGKLFKIDGVYEPSYLFGVYKSRTLFDGVHLLDSLNATVALPSYVNKFDTDFVESPYRPLSEKFFSDVIDGRCPPWVALERYLLAVAGQIDGDEKDGIATASRSSNPVLVEPARRELFKCFRDGTITLTLDTRRCPSVLRRDYLYGLFEFSNLERVLLESLAEPEREIIFAIRCRSLKAQAVNSKSEFFTEIVDPFATPPPPAPVVDLNLVVGSSPSI